MSSEVEFSPTSGPINRGAGISNQFPRPVLLINSDGFAKANDEELFDDNNDDDDHDQSHLSEYFFAKTNDMRY